MRNLNTLNNDLSAAILASDLLEELLHELGASVKRTANGAFRGQCPVHQGDRFNFVVGTGKLFPIFWACHSNQCHKARKLKGNLLGLVRGALTGDPDRPASVSEAEQFIQGILARDGGGSTGVVRAARPAQSTWSLTRSEVRARLEIPSPYFLVRGFSPAVLDRFDVGDSRKTGRAVAPIYDADGGLCVGCISRSMTATAEPRWMFPAGFPKGDYLYNYSAAYRSRTPSVLLVEGVPDVLRAAEAGVEAVAAFGTALTETQLFDLWMLFKRVVVAFDNDEAGVRGATAAAALLKNNDITATVKHPPPEYKDVGDMPASTVAEWFTS